MTTIAYKDGIIAYDSRCCVGSTIVDNNYNKRINIEGVQFFVSGTVADHERACLAFFTDDIDLIETDVVFIANDYGKLYICNIDHERMFKTPESTKSVFAIGSGQDHALTAMDCGLSAKEAIKMAMKRDVGTGGRVRIYKL
jgi:ATP-dependent protease HslVU (ClpYQ) peptidase subunit